MGLSGLTRHVSQNLARFVGQDAEFPAACSGAEAGTTALVIDLSAWAWHLYLQLLPRSPVWGVLLADLDMYTSRFVTLCRVCRLEPVFVADGPSPQRKAATGAERVSARRAQGQRYMAQVASAPHDAPPPRLPPHMPASTRQTLRSILHSKGVDVVYALGEADGLTARLARERGGIVLSNDSDFFVLQAHEGGCRFAQLREMVTLAALPTQTGELITVDAWLDTGVQLVPDAAARRSLSDGQTAEQPHLALLRLKVYEPVRLAQVLSMPLVTLPVVAAMTENDFASEEYMSTLHAALGRRFDERFRRLLVLVRDEARLQGIASVGGPGVKTVLNSLSAAVLSRIVRLAQNRRRPPAFVSSSPDPLPPPLQAKFDRLVPGLLSCLQAYLDDDVDAEIAGVLERTHERQTPTQPDALGGRAFPTPNPKALVQYTAAYRAGQLPAGLLALLAYGNVSLPVHNLVDPTLPPIEGGATSDLYAWCASVMFSGRRGAAARSGQTDEPGKMELRALRCEPRYVPVDSNAVCTLLCDGSDDCSPQCTAELADHPVLLPEPVRERIFSRALQIPPFLACLAGIGSHGGDDSSREGAQLAPLSLVFAAAALCLAVRDLASRSPTAWSRHEVQAGVLALCASHVDQLRPSDALAVRSRVRWVSRQVEQMSKRPSVRTLHLASSLDAVLLACQALYSSLLLPSAAGEGMARFDPALFKQAVHVFDNCPVPIADGRHGDCHDVAPDSVLAVLVECIMTSSR